jgi:poly(hydroxyalkanoate) depolymerase family esterase
VKLLARLLLTCGVLVAALSMVTPVRAASLTQVTGFGNNPSNLNMYIYVPNNVAAKPALLVAIHFCTGSASALFNGEFHDYVTAADQYGYIIVFPEATRSGQCFDVYSSQALTRGGGSDPVGIMSMVNYTKSHYNVDPSRVFVSGASSGAMMTNVMAAEYPDVFAAGAAFMGVPATCFATTGSSTWNSDCANGNITKTAQQWGDAARAMYPGYSGSYPRMQLWHGTADATLNYHNFGEEIKQWTNLKGVSQTPVSTDSPQSGWTRTRYGSNTTQAPVEGISINGVGHALPTSGMVGYAISFLGLNGSSPTPTPTPATPTPTATPTGAPNGTVSINAGGSATGSFTADQYYSGGTAYTNTNTVDESQITSNVPPAAVFQSERYGAMTYTIPNRTAGSSQTVTLYFDETYVTAAGQRVFSVSINGTNVLSSFDIYASAGGQNKAIARTFTTTANSSGQVVIGFTAQTENPKVNGITVAGGGVGPTPTPTATPTGTPTATATASGGTCSSTNISINSGGSATGSFTADQYFSGGTTYTNTATVSTSLITSNPPPAAVFNSERYGAMTYTIPGLTSGCSYTVTLYFAETYLTAAGQRLFSVSINGTSVLSSFDIYASAGGQNKAIARTFTTTANSSGQVVIAFTAQTENPKVNGITVSR